MHNPLSLDSSDFPLRNDTIQLINMLLCISAIIAAFFSRFIAWGILLLPFAYVLFTAFATRPDKLKNIAELSDNAKVMLQNWNHYYLHPGLCAACRAVGLTAPVVAIIGCFHGSYLGLAFAVAICLLTFNVAPVFDPTNSLRDPIDRQAHEEVIALVNQRWASPTTSASTK